MLLHVWLTWSKCGILICRPKTQSICATLSYSSHTVRCCWWYCYCVVVVGVVVVVVVVVVVAVVVAVVVVVVVVSAVLVVVVVVLVVLLVVTCLPEDVEGRWSKFWCLELQIVNQCRKYYCSMIMWISLTVPQVMKEKDTQMHQKSHLRKCMFHFASCPLLTSLPWQPSQDCFGHGTTA